jgi:2-oxo-4-hydroxy-4-carboxy-5-ureidoimidazoline decarboxylase
MKLEKFNALDPAQAREELLRCCGSTRWVNAVMKQFPFRSVEELKNTSDAAWRHCGNDDFLEAFSHHPKIGERKAKISSGNETWSAREQSGVENAATALLTRLQQLNRDYEKKFGFIFIVCATGKSAEEMLTLLENRFNNNPEKEIQLAAAEQNKITHLRIEKLFA